MKLLEKNRRKPLGPIDKQRVRSDIKSMNCKIKN